MSEAATDEAHRHVSSSVGMAVPNNPDRYGYLSEHHSYGQNEKEASQYAEDLAAYMLATTLGEDFDISEIWDQDKKIYKISEEVIVRTKSITQIANGKKGLWTTTIAAAILIA
jgi:arginine decarboxylase